MITERLEENRVHDQFLERRATGASLMIAPTIGRQNGQPRHRT